jgi:hypothetical protein
VAFSPDGQRVISGSGDQTLRLWDARTGQALGEPWQGHSDGVWSVAFSPDGRRVISGSRDQTLRLWDMDEASWRQRTCFLAGRNFTWVEWQRYMPEPRYPYARTCEAYPVHPTVIAFWLDEAARLLNAQETHAADQYYQQALAAAQETPVKYDMIALYLDKLRTLTTRQPAHPLIPRLREAIQAWVAVQPETNQHYWQEQLAKR